MFDSKRLHEILIYFNDKNLKKLVNGSNIDMFAFEFAFENDLVHSNSYSPVATGLKTYQFPVLTTK
ncbi:hypothetical protein MED121_01100 [Marinomonas sp. MED121]|nr:hypothetical protein MED121_01100 [Marinomonas sp. MED121]